MTPRPLAITMGDPAGVGPEIIVKAISELQPRIEAGMLRLVVISSNAALEANRARFAPGISIPSVTAGTQTGLPCAPCKQVQRVSHMPGAAIR